MEDLLRSRSCRLSRSRSFSDRISIGLTIVNAIRDTWKPWDTSLRRVYLLRQLETITLGGRATRNTMLNG